ncbi:MAG: S-layer homology domain-containing protein [Clostridia bacterium]|nr:S-layer homology domain-containing protein [Clostridia bacterium]
MKTKVFLLVLLLSLCAITSFAHAPSGWATEEVGYAISAGYVSTELQTDFDAPVTRCEFACMAVEFLRYELGFSRDEFNEKVNELFDDVVFSDSLDESIILAARCGIIYGYDDGTFAPDKFITRREAATMLARVYNLYGNIYAYSDINFLDNNLISDWALSDVKFCVEKGVMKGVSDTHFDPQGLFTKEQAIVTFWRLDTDTDWENHNKTAKIRRKMTKEIAESELFANGTVILLEKYDTSYGTVYYTLTSGMMHSPGYDLLLIDESGKTYSLTSNVPSEKEYRCVPEIKNIVFCPEGQQFGFEVIFETELYSENGDEIHKAGTYYFEVNLVKKETTLINYEPINENLFKKR